MIWVAPVHAASAKRAGAVEFFAPRLDRDARREAAAPPPRLGLEEEDFLGDDLDRVTFYALAVGPLRVVEAALHLDQVALLLVLGDRGAEAVEGGDAVEFGEGLSVAGLVLDCLAVDQLGAIGDEGERGDCLRLLGEIKWTDESLVIKDISCPSCNSALIKPSTEHRAAKIENQYFDCVSCGQVISYGDLIAPLKNEQSYFQISMDELND